MLIDDDKFDNIYHERVIKKSGLADVIISKSTADAALEYLRSGAEPKPDIIFLDINMPAVNGWEFLEEYNAIDQTMRKNATVIMLSTSETPEDAAKAKTFGFVCDFKTKPLNAAMLEDIVEKHLA